MAVEIPETLDSLALSARAQAYYQQIFKPRLASMRAEIARTTLTVMLWGPGPEVPELYAKRIQIRDELRRRGHAVFFAEERANYRRTSESEKAIDFLDASAADAIVVLQLAYGPIAEVQDFADYGVISAKLLIFVAEGAADSADYREALGDLRAHYNNVETFQMPADLESCRLKTRVVERLELLQATKWRGLKNPGSWGITAHG